MVENMGKEIENCICGNCGKKALAIQINIIKDQFYDLKQEIFYYACNCGWESPLYALDARLPKDFEEQWMKENDIAKKA